MEISFRPENNLLHKKYNVMVSHMTNQAYTQQPPNSRHRNKNNKYNIHNKQL